MAAGTVWTDAGQAFYVDLFDGTVSPPANYYIGWGTGTTTPAVSDTTLETASAESRVVATLSQPASDTNRLVGTIVSSGSQTITEVGTFTASTSGTLIVHSVFTGIAVAASDAIQFTINLQLKDTSE